MRLVEIGDWVPIWSICVCQKSLHHLTDIVIFAFIKFYFWFLCISNGSSLIKLERLPITSILFARERTLLTITRRLVVIWSFWWTWCLFSHILRRHQIAHHCLRHLLRGQRLPKLSLVHLFGCFFFSYSHLEGLYLFKLICWWNFWKSFLLVRIRQWS